MIAGARHRALERRTTTVAAAFVAAVAEHPEEPALRSLDAPGDGKPVTWTWRRYGEAVAGAAAGLRLLGVGRGTRLAVMLPNQPAFHVIDTAATLLRATPFSPYLSSSPARLHDLLARAEATLVVVQDETAARAVDAVRAGLGVSAVMVVDAADAGPGRVAFDDVITAAPLDIEALASSVRPGDALTIASTSGTTGRPKAALFDHRQVGAMTDAVRTVIARPVAGWRVLSWMPLAQIAERLASLYMHPVAPFEVTTCPDPTALHRHLTVVRPHVFVAVPGVWERFADGVRAHAAGADPAVIRAGLGLDACEVAVVTAAPAAADLVVFFRSLGVPLSEMYGLMEACGPVAWDAVDVRPGWAGRPVPGCDVRLAADGEILVRGPGVMRSYVGDPVGTAAAVDADGWLHTDDLGEMDPDGYLRVVDRRHEIFLLADGTRVAPVRIEERLRELPLVATACVVGDGRPYVAALITVDREEAGSRGVDPADLDAVGRVVGGEIEAATACIPAGLRIVRFTVLPDVWEPGANELTPTMKLKRTLIARRYAAEIASMYAAL